MRLRPFSWFEEDVQAPVHEPGALLHLLEHRREGVGVDQLLQLRHVLQRDIPGHGAKMLQHARVGFGVNT